MCRIQKSEIYQEAFTANQEEHDQDGTKTEKQDSLVS